MKVPFARVFCDGNELRNVSEVLRSGWLTTAKKTAEFERLFAETIDARHACAVNSCTAALHLAVEAMGLGPGDKVLVPTMTFTASAEVVRYVGADPILTDVDYGTGLITPEILSAALEQHPDAKAVVVVHFGGQPARMLGEEGILAICQRSGVRIVEDAAHAFPARIGEHYVGSWGDATCFSFYANKTITSAEGGMLLSNDDALVKRARVMRLHGIDRDVWDRFTSNVQRWEYDVVAPGFKYNMPDLCAAVGLAQLERAAVMRKQRQLCAQYYKQELANIAGLDLPQQWLSDEEHAWHLFPVVLAPEARLDRNACIELLGQRGVGTSVHYKPIHRLSYYRERYGLKAEDYPQAERRWRGCLSLPIFAGITEEERAFVVESLRVLLD